MIILRKKQKSYAASPYAKEILNMGKIKKELLTTGKLTTEQQYKLKALELLGMA